MLESVVGRGVRRFGRAARVGATDADQALVSADLNRPDFAAAAGLTMFGSVSSHPPATVVSVSVASLGFRTDIMLLALGGSSITEHDGLTVVATPRTPDFWWGNFVLAPDASALDTAVALHAEMFPDADFV
jgi:hypothetical protein